MKKNKKEPIPEYFESAEEAAQELQRISEAEGISAETMANLWLQEKLQEKMRKGEMKT